MCVKRNVLVFIARVGMCGVLMSDRFTVTRRQSLSDQDVKVPLRLFLGVLWG